MGVCDAGVVRQTVSGGAAHRQRWLRGGTDLWKDEVSKTSRGGRWRACSVLSGRGDEREREITMNLPGACYMSMTFT